MSNTNKETTISPIAIDLGAANTGVQFLHDVKFSGNKGVVEVSENIGKTFVFDSSQIQFLQKERTAKRHSLRGLKRRKMVKRLLRCFLNHHKIEYQQFAKEIDFLNGLLNRRGYTYAQEGLDLEFLKQKDVSKIFFALLKDTKFKDTKAKTAARFCLEDMAELELEDLKECRKALLVDMDEYKRLADEKLGQTEKKDIDGKKKRKGLLDNLRKNLEGYVEKLIQEQEEGAKHRKTYLKNIQDDFKLLKKRKGFGLANLLQNLNLKEEEFLRFIGNISNLQLRTLRKYFNKKEAPDVWDEKRLEKYVKNSIIAWHCKEEEDVCRRKELLSDLNKKRLFKFLTQTDPKETIPPYEDQNNRRPPRCASIYLNPCGLDNKFPQWETTVENLLEKHSFSKQLKNFTGIEETQKSKRSTSLEKIRIPEFEGKALDVSEKKKERQKKAHILQRMLDISRDHDQYQLRDLVRKYEEQNKDTKACEGHDGFSMLKDHLKDAALCNTYIKFAHIYYSRIDEARRGVWDAPQRKEDAKNNIFFCCDHNPPHKNKIAFALVNNLLGTNMESEDLEEFRKGFWKEEGVGSYRSLMSFSKFVEEIRKLHGNAFGQKFIKAYLRKVEHDTEIGDKDFKKLVKTLTDDIEKNEGNDFFQRMQSYLGISKTKRPESRDNKIFGIAKYYAGKLYIVAQMYQTLETDVHGFSKDCEYCVRENGWRMREEEVENRYPSARAVRLSNDSVVPFDGFLGRYLMRLADEIVTVKKEQLKDIKEGKVFVPICIEQNRFEFEKTLAKQKGKMSKSNSEMDSSRAKDKEERIKDDSNDVCPYCGNSIKDGDIDHIIPRSHSLKKYGTIFNSEANLIYVCRSCNRDKKGDGLFSFKDLKGAYLKKVFKGQDVDGLERKIKEDLDFLKKKRIVNFMNLDAKIKKYVKHGLFIKEIRDEIINKVLNTRIRTLVNGTQAYLVKRINQGLLAFGIDKKITISSYPFMIPAADEDWMLYKSKYEFAKDKKDKKLEDLIEKKKSSLKKDGGMSATKEANLENMLRDLQPQWQLNLVEKYKEKNGSMKSLRDLRVQWLLDDAGTSAKANRTLLAIDYPDYEKQEIQGKQSHIVDATMTFVSVLREARRLTQVLEKANIGKEEQKKLSEEIAKKYNEEGSMTLYESLLPCAKDRKIKNMERKNQEDGKKIWESSIFNGTLYGESFYPVYLHANGKLDFGYRHPNGTKKNVEVFEENEKKRNPENEFNLLVPFFKGSGTSDYQQSLDTLKKQGKQKHQVYSIDKRKAFTFYEDVFYSRKGQDLLNLNKETNERVELLEKLRFYTCRVDVLELMKNKPAKKPYFMYQETVRDFHRGRIKEEIKKHYAKEEENSQKTRQRFELALGYLEEREDLFGADYDEDFREEWNAWKMKQDSWEDKERKFPYVSKEKNYTVCTRIEAKKRLSEYAKKQKAMSQTRKKALATLKSGKPFSKEDINKYSFVSAAYVEEYRKSESERVHKKVPTKISIKQAQSVNGTFFRVRRKSSVGNQDIYQLGVIYGSGSTLGTNSGREVLLRELSKDKNLVCANQKWWEKWQPYQKGLDIEKPVPQQLNVGKEIESVYYEPRRSKDKSWITLILNRSKNEKFLKIVDRKEEEGKFKIPRKSLFAYLDKTLDLEDVSEIKPEKEADELVEKLAKEREKNLKDDDFFIMPDEEGTMEVEEQGGGEGDSKDDKKKHDLITREYDGEWVKFKFKTNNAALQLCMKILLAKHR